MRSTEHVHRLHLVANGFQYSERRGACEAIDPLSDITRVGRSLPCNAIDDRQLLGRQILKLVHECTRKVAPVEARDEVFAQHQLRKAQQVVIRQLLSRTAGGLDLESEGVTTGTKCCL